MLRELLFLEILQVFTIRFHIRHYSDFNSILILDIDKTPKKDINNGTNSPINTPKSTHRREGSLKTNVDDLSKLTSFLVYLNQDTITETRASNWSTNYIIRKVNVFKKDKVYLEFLSEDEDKVICRGEASQIFGAEDSTRYFIIMQAYWEESNSLRNTGFAFYTRDESKRFLKFIKLHSGITITSVLNKDFGALDLKYKEREYIPLIPDDNPESIIAEEEINEINELTNKLLSKVNLKNSQDELNLVRDKINQRLSQRGIGVIISKEEKEVKDKNYSTILSMKRVITGISKELETPELHQMIVDELSKPEHMSFAGDIEVWVENFFNTVGTEIKTAKLLKAVTQSIIHIATYHIKTKIKNDIMTGDVRGPEGWQIVILFAREVIYVTHRRREKSIDALGPKSQFWYEWELNIVFDKKLNDITSTTLKITDIGYGEDIDIKNKEKLSNLFCNGNLFIA